MRRTRAVLIFFVCGLATGLSFGLLLSARSLMTFWFIKGNKFLIPTYRYYLGVGIFTLLGLFAAYTISRLAGLLHDSSSIFRKMVSALIVATSALILFGTARMVEEQTATRVVTERGTVLFPNIDPITLNLWGIGVFVLLISTACWILTAKLHYVGLFLNFLTQPVTFVLLTVAAKIPVVPSEWSELITYPVYFSMLVASCGFWIATSMHATE